MSSSHQPPDANTLREELADRLADLALCEVLGTQRPPDLAANIVAASQQRPRSRRTLAIFALAASVLIALGIGSWYRWQARQGREQTIATRSSIDATASVENATLRQMMGTHFGTSDVLRDKQIHDVTSDARAPHRNIHLIDQDGETFEKQRLGTTVYPVADLVLPADPIITRGDAYDVMFMVTPRIIVQEEAESLAIVDADGWLKARVDQGRGPGEAGDRYSRIVENPFLKPTDNPLSTFSIDVDTASYAKARQYLLQNGVLPPADAVRIEEFVNYFPYDYAPPKDEGKPFASHVEVAACPWQPKHRLVRIGLKGREIEREARPASNLVFLLDVSGSMEPDDRLPRVRRSMKMLVEQLGENDRVAMVVYAGATGLALPTTPAYRQDEILNVLDNLHAGGSTNGGAGIQLAYDTATAHFIKGGTNRVILCTDGDFNVGTTSTAELERMAEEKAKTGVFLTVLGFGMGNHNDDMLEKLADKGNGNYGYIDTEEEARKLLVEQLSGTLVTIAKDVKIQVEFNPRTVGAYRLLGYENRMLRAEDFNDDKKDAGEIGAGHTVTALYEIVPAGEKLDTPPVDPLRYQQLTQPTDATASGELLTLKLRYKDPDGQESKAPLIFPVSDRGLQFGQASKDFRFAAAVAGFAMLLRDSPHRGNLTYDAALEIAQEGLGEDRHGYRAAFLELAKRAKNIAGKP